MTPRDERGRRRTVRKGFLHKLWTRVGTERGMTAALAFFLMFTLVVGSAVGYVNDGQEVTDNQPDRATAGESNDNDSGDTGDNGSDDSASTDSTESGGSGADDGNGDEDEAELNSTGVPESTITGDSDSSDMLQKSITGVSYSGPASMTLEPGAVCRERDLGENQRKVDNPSGSGTETITVNGKNYKFRWTIDDSGDYTVLNWEADIGLDIESIFVKGGTDAYIYSYSTPVQSDQGLHAPKNSGGNIADISHFCFTFCVPPTGELKVDKEFVLGNASDDVKPESVQVTITGESGTSHENGDTKTLNEGNDWTYTWEDLIPGEYTITEDNLGSEWAVSVSPETATVVAGQTKEVTVTNTYEGPEFGELKVDKEFVLGDASGDVKPDSVQLTITGESGGSHENGDTKTLNEGNGWTYTWEDLIPGEYTVTEDNLGSEWAVSVSPETATVVGGERAEVTVTNTYAVGSLYVEKIVWDNEDNPELTDDTEFTLVLTGPKDSCGNDLSRASGLVGGVQAYSSPATDRHTFTIQPNQENKLTGLAPGWYRVTEENLPLGYELVSINGHRPAHCIQVGPAEAINGVGEASEPELAPDIVVVNRKLETGSLSIEKEVVDEGGTPIADDAAIFTVNISGPGEDGDYDEDVTFTADDGAFRDELELGTYSIEEIDIPEGYTFKGFKYGNQDTLTEISTESPLEVTLGEETKDVRVVVVNEQEAETGSLTIEKELVDEDEEPITDDDTRFSVNITGPDGYDEDVTFRVGASRTLSGLKLGEYTIEEIDVPDGYEFLNFKVDDEDEATPVTVTLDEDTLSLTVIAVNEREDGALTIAKELVDQDGDPITDDNTRFSVNITGPDGYDEDVTFRVGASRTLAGLELGDYTIEEIDVPDGYEFLNFKVDGENEATPVTVTLDEDTLSLTVTAVNEREDGVLTIAKELVDEDGDPITGDTTRFAVNITGPGGFDEDVTFRVGASRTLAGLELGDYTIEEIDVPEGYEFLNFKVDGENETTPVTVTLDEDTLSLTVTAVNEREDEDEPDEPVVEDFVEEEEVEEPVDEPVVEEFVEEEEVDEPVVKEFVEDKPSVVDRFFRGDLPFTGGTLLSLALLGAALATGGYALRRRRSR